MNIFSYIKQHISILDVIGEYVRLKKAGLYHKGCCPFHHEKTASFTISPHKEIFYCFGCHAGGDVISFISRIEQCSQLEAAKLLSERYSLELPSDMQLNEPQTYDKKKRYSYVTQLVAQWCHELLLKSPAVLHYVHDRGFDKTCLSTFAIGYFPEGPATIKALIAYAIKHQVLVEDLLQAHIIRQSKTTFYSPFEQRILFPIIDQSGNYCGFGGRIFKNQDTRSKYYNSQENEFFNKGSLLYGLNIAKETIQKKNTAFLVEGYTDCIAMVQHGYKNTVATLGTACTFEQLKLLSRYCEQVYVLYDSDNAGQEAILRIAELCWQVNLELKIITLPDSKDPAAYLKHTLNIDPLIKDAKNIFTFFVESVASNFTQQSLNHKLQATHRIIALISKINDHLKQDILLQEASRILQISYATLKESLHQSPTFNTTHEQNKRFQPEIIIQHIKDEEPKLEKKILCAILNHAPLLHKYKQVIFHLLSERYEHILRKMDALLARKEDYSISELFESLDDEEKQLASQALFAGEGPEELTDFEHLLFQLQKKHWKTIVNSIKSKLEEAKNSDDNQKVTELMQQFATLKQMMLEKN